MNLIENGIADGLIKFNEDGTRITYTNRNKTYNFKDPEEAVRAETFVQLVKVYGYAPEKIDIEVRVPRRTPNDLADIVVYADDLLTNAYIVVECKKETVTDAEYKQALEQGFGNANSLKASFLWVSSKTLNNYYDVAGFGGMEREKNQLADIPRFGKTEVSKARFYKGGVNEDGETAFDIGEIAESELTRLFKQAHQALWGGGKRGPSEAFDELDKLIFCKIRDERRARKKGTPYDFQVFTKEEPEKLQERIHKIYEEGRAADPEVFRDDIRLNARELETIVGYLAKINLSATDLDSKGRAFESFMGSFFRGEFGQYFTPRPVVDFIVDVLPIEKDDFVLDPSCGSSGFLLHILNKIRKQADEFYDVDAEQLKHYQYWHDFAEHKLYGIEINDQIARTAKMNMILHDDGHTNVLAHDGLEPIEKIQRYALANKSRGYLSFQKNHFGHITTNPPFGSVIKANEKAYIGDFELGRKNFDWVFTKLNNIKLDDDRDSQKSEILFIEQCYKFLKPGGFLAIVLPDGILTNSSLQYVRDWIEEHFRIVAVVSLPQTAFTHTGAGVKSSVLFARKYEEKTTIAIRDLKKDIQDKLFNEARYHAEFARLFNDKAKELKDGDLVIREINELLVNHFAALRSQETLTKADEKQLIREANEKIKKHKETEAYKMWRQEVNDKYAEQIEAVREALNDEYLEKVREQAANYPIFMAIAEDIGYDATGRETRRNELTEIGAQLKKFIKSVVEGKDSFFASALI
ncbi:MAG TPA: N-6 DNA methylase [Pyrinomonadaceae bacterium]|jgi:type I restriction enzyme M protein